MDSGVVVALIAAAGGLLTSMYTLQRQRIHGTELTILQHDLDEKTHKEQRDLAAVEQLDRAREPLLRAAEDLKYRINNIRGNFLIYIHATDDARRRVALLGTLYRFGKFWAVVESLYTIIDVLRFESDEDTKAVSELLISIATEFASDYPDDLRLMVWREEQRAIGELMTRDVGIGSIGFAAFTDLYDAKLSTWFSSMARDIQSEGIDESARLTRLEGLLGQLVDQLKKGRRLAL